MPLSVCLKSLVEVVYHKSILKICFVRDEMAMDKKVVNEMTIDHHIS